MPIGLFDSGYGGLSTLKAAQAALPDQSFIYLGDHANAPYGARDKNALYKLTTQHCDWLFHNGCNLVVLACNTASSVVRRIQHEWLPTQDTNKRVLGIVVPTIERVTGLPWCVNASSQNLGANATVGVFATDATVRSNIYPLEIHKRAPNIRVIQQACPDLVHLIETGAADADIAASVHTYVNALKTLCGGTSPDYVLLGCTHYALVHSHFRATLDDHTQIIDQPSCVADSLSHYLQRHDTFRDIKPHPDLRLFTTGDAQKINRNGQPFMETGWHFSPITAI